MAEDQLSVARTGIEVEHRPPPPAACSLTHPLTEPLFQFTDTAMDADLSKLTPNERSELMDKVKAQVLVANFQEMLSTITEKCFAKCIQKPGSALDSSETKCLNLCMDRFMDAKQLVARTYLGRVSRESSLN